ncbi:anaerobic sulfatase maturase [Providencia sp. CRE-3FA-0001]|uniref:Anaerobic sulfatase maturase n=1 Tax=Providencia huashanensis TaxID=3037798 RepID=A0AA42JTS4_9GAMM|nr:MULTISPECIES: anaerobic sulfatase maturase [Providencia]EJD6663643.1 anaerobic sulfatase maturase [Providencia rettgeri]ELR5076556.1 anaerobic sulfatase maturase [Providencia rettgeri]ELR5172149.1 anaerobic sulfatase maturase [Providencia rettgeri]ELR5194985.1 anaerobic sulfatase maturase [Providencia rettgeri]EMB8478314.1 anaerobic sulfatase maturase [Providencia rettgeri]
MKKAFHIMAKPTSYQCNLKCDYCFYLEKEHQTDFNSKKLKCMDDNTLREYIRQYIELSPSHEIDFTWQGGEPLMARMDFFQRVIQYQKRYGKGKQIYNSIQTNGVLLTAEWAKFLKEHHFLVGISLDGPQWLHDIYRKSNSGNSVFDKVINAIRLLKEYQIDFNILTVINNETAKYPEEIYRFITEELQANYLQFIPVVEYEMNNSKFQHLSYPQEAGEKTLTSWSITGKQYGDFINKVFDIWVRKDVGKVFVQLFDNSLAAWSGDMPSFCVMQPACGYGLVAEQNGDIYSCDHFVYPEFKLGNLLSKPLNKLVYSKQQQRFGQQKLNLSSLCQKCEFKFACHGGCPKHRTEKVENKWHNHLCEGYKAIFSHIDPYMQYMANELRFRRPPALVMDNLHLFQRAAPIENTIPIRHIN